MRTFVSTDGTTFLFPGVESGLVGTLQVPSIDALLEFAEYVKEEREAISRGPKLVESRSENLPALLLNGGFLRIASDDTLPRGAIHFLNALGERAVLRAGGSPAVAEEPCAPGGIGAAGSSGDC